MSEWISIPGWRRFQHYDPSKRQPPWVKTYTELLDDEDYLDLSSHLRGVLHGIWLSYAATRCQLRASTSTLSARLRLRVVTRDLVSLSDAGFITIVASKTLAEGYHDASDVLSVTRAGARSQETETETETEKSSQSLSELQDDASPNGRVATEAEIVAARERRERSGWVDNLSEYTGCRYVRGEVGISAKYDPLGKEHPPDDWPYSRPTKQEVVAALRGRDELSA